MGKAIDADVAGVPNDAPNETDRRRRDRERSNSIRGLLVELADAQIGWFGRNRKSIEPEKYAPTWIHWDVRSYDHRFLDDRHFVKSEDELLADFESSIS